MCGLSQAQTHCSVTPSGCLARAVISRRGDDDRLSTPRSAWPCAGAARGCGLVGSQLMGPSRMTAFSLVEFGADVVAGSSPSTIAISSSRKSQGRAGRRRSVVRNPKFFPKPIARALSVPPSSTTVRSRPGLPGPPWPRRVATKRRCWGLSDDVQAEDRGRRRVLLARSEANNFPAVARLGRPAAGTTASSDHARTARHGQLPRPRSR